MTTYVRSFKAGYDVQQETYNGPKKPLMPPEQATHYVPPLSPLASKAITKQWTLENEFAFLQDIHTKTNCPEYNGYNTRQCRQAGMLPQPHTEVERDRLRARTRTCVLEREIGTVEAPVIMSVAGELNAHGRWQMNTLQTGHRDIIIHADIKVAWFQLSSKIITGSIRKIPH